MIRLLRRRILETTSHSPTTHKPTKRSFLGRACLGKATLGFESLEERALFAVGATFMPTTVAAGTGFDGVVLFDGGCTGVLLEDGRHVLTAAHCVDGSGPNRDGLVDPETYDIDFDLPNGQETISIPAAQAANRITIHPTWVAQQTSSAGSDLAIVELPEIGAGGRSNGSQLFRASNEVGQTYTLIGYGIANSSGDNGAEQPGGGLPPGAVSDDVKRQSSNVFESTGSRILREVQSVELNATGGTFKLSFGGDSTSAIAFNASAAAVESALEALPSLAPADIQVYGGPGLWYVNFLGAYAGVDVALLGADSSGLTGGASTVDVDEEIAGDRYTMAAADVLLYDFDNGTSANDSLGRMFGITNTGLGAATEAIQAAGDSGGPFFLGNLVAGLVSTRLTDLGDDTAAPLDVSVNDSTFGEIGIVTRISTFASWIDAQLADSNIDLVLDMQNQNEGDDGTADEIEIKVVAGQFELRVNGTLFYQDALSDLDSVTIRGSGDDDTLIVDYSGGNPIPNGDLTFDARGGAANSLIIRNGSWTTVDYQYTGAIAGSIDLDSTTIHFDNLASIINTGSSADTSFVLPAGPNTDLVLSDDGFGDDPNGPTAGASALAGGLIVFTQFANPTNSLTIPLGPNGDKLEIEALDAAFDADVVVEGGAGADEIRIGAITGGTSQWSVDGKGGTDKLTIDYAATVAFTGAGAGTVTSTAGLSPLDFTSIEDFQLLGDYGDAPDSYGTSLSVGGAQHPAGSALFLGAAVDSEYNGLPSGNGLADDGDGVDDEDGVLMSSTLIARLDAKFTITASAAGKLDAWIDFNRDGVFAASERIADSVALTAGENTLLITVPENVVAGATFARFRVSTAGGLGPTGSALDGEVEDYPLALFIPAPGTVQLLDDPANPGTGLLLVNGRAISDAIVVRPSALQPTQLEALISPFVVSGLFPAANVQRVVAFGLGGNDSIVMDSRLLIPTQLFGDDGNDSLVGASGDDFIDAGAGIDSVAGGAGNDIILGGLGDDSLSGDAGFDIIIGGGGRDTITGGLHEDIIIGGNTTLAGLDLRAALVTWTNGAAFNTRIAALAGKFNAATVVDDGIADFIFGSGGRDWMLDFALRDLLLDFDPNPTTGDRRN